MSALQELRERRTYECRLTPDRALSSLEEAHEFLLDRGLLTRTADSALPSLYEACHEDPYAAHSRGFGSWPATKWPWFGELAARPNVYRLNVHRGKNILFSGETAALADPICRRETDRMAAEAEDWALVLEHLESAGPSTPEDLRVELALKPKELKAILSPLERCGVVVRRDVVLETHGEGNEHLSEVARWVDVYPEPSGRGGLDDLVVAGVRAAVVAPEPELARWFSWPWRWDDGLVDRLVEDGRLVRVGEGFVTAPASV